MERSFFGQYLINKGIINALQLTEAIKLQERTNQGLGEIAEASGILNKDQVRQILSFQMRRDVYFGQAAKELGFLKEEEINKLLRAQKEAHLFLGDALVKLGYISETQKNQALQDFLKESEKLKQSLEKEVPEELKAVKDLLDKFCLHAVKVLLRLSGIPAKCSSYRFRDKEISLDEISVEVSFEGSLSRRLTRLQLALSQEMAKVIAEKTYKKSGFPTKNEKEEPLINAELAGDVIGEMGNIIAGQVCNEFAPPELSPGIPYVKFIKGEKGFRHTLLETEKAASLSLSTPFQPLGIYLIFTDNPPQEEQEKKDSPNRPTS